MSKTEDVSLVRYAQAVMILTQIKNKYGIGSTEAKEAELRFGEDRKAGKFKHQRGAQDDSHL